MAAEPNNPDESQPDVDQTSPKDRYIEQLAEEENWSKGEGELRDQDR